MCQWYERCPKGGYQTVCNFSKNGDFSRASVSFKGGGKGVIA